MGRLLGLVLTPGIVAIVCRPIGFAIPGAMIVWVLSSRFGAAAYFEVGHTSIWAVSSCGGRASVLINFSK